MALVGCTILYQSICMNRMNISGSLFVTNNAQSYRLFYKYHRANKFLYIEGNAHREDIVRTMQQNNTN